MFKASKKIFKALKVVFNSNEDKDELLPQKNEVSVLQKHLCK